MWEGPGVEVWPDMGRRQQFPPAAITPLIQAFVQKKQTTGVTAATVKVYEWWLYKLADQVPDTAALDSLALERFFTRLRERGLKASSIHQAYRNVKTFCRWLKRARVIRDNPIDGVDSIRTPKIIPFIPKPAELRAVLGACGDTTRGKRARAMVLCMADAGLRSAEVRHLLLEHLDLHEGTVLVRGGKGLKDRTAPISPPTIRAIKEYLLDRGDVGGEDYVFVGRRGRPLGARHLIAIMHRLSRRAGIPENRWLFPHSLRHLALTSWVKAGMPVEKVQLAAGHSHIGTTMRYVHLAADDVKRAHREAGALEKMLRA